MCRRGHSHGKPKSPAGGEGVEITERFLVGSLFRFVLPPPAVLSSVAFRTSKLLKSTKNTSRALLRSHKRARSSSFDDRKGRGWSLLGAPIQHQQDQPSEAANKRKYVTARLVDVYVASCSSSCCRLCQPCPELSPVSGLRWDARAGRHKEAFCRFIIQQADHLQLALECRARMIKLFTFFDCVMPFCVGSHRTTAAVRYKYRPGYKTYVTEAFNP